MGHESGKIILIVGVALGGDVENALTRFFDFGWFFLLGHIYSSSHLFLVDTLVDIGYITGGEVDYQTGCITE